MGTGGAEPGGRELARRSRDRPVRPAVRTAQRWVGAALVLAAAILLTGTLLSPAQVTDSLAGSVPASPGPAATVPTPDPHRPTPVLTTTGAAALPQTVSGAKPRGARLPSAQAPRPSAPSERSLRPERITIPVLGIDRRPVPLHVLGDGSLQAPPRYDDVGWWKNGPLPGSAGNAVVVGHVDSTTGPAVFYGLATLQRGDQMAVTRRDAAVVRFRVRNVQRFPVADFPADRVFRRSGPPGLVLITCGGTYDRVAGRYLDNVVVFADRVDDGNRPPADGGQAPDPTGVQSRRSEK